MQTNRNIEEMNCHYKGYEICDPIRLYCNGGEYYIAGKQVKLQKKYPIVRDEVLRVYNNDPYMIKSPDSSPNDTLYLHPISRGTATVLQRKDGYANREIIQQEIMMHPKQWTPIQSLPHASDCKVQACVVPSSSPSYITGLREPQCVPFWNRALSKIDFVLVDIPGTVVYNVSIPFCAPFIFFKEFLSED